MPIDAEAEGRAMAVSFRAEHGLGSQPLGDVVAVIEQATKIDVAVIDVEDDNEHGMAMRDPERDVAFIGVARTANPMRQRSTLAHELAHVLFEDWAEEGYSSRSPEEIRADAFARHFLVPLEGLREFVGGRPVTEPVLSAVVQRFLVSPAIASIALHQAGLIDAVTKQQWMMTSSPRLATRYGWSDQYRALQSESDRARAPQRLLARANEGYREGVLRIEAIATLRGVPAAVAEEELRDAGLSPAAEPGDYDPTETTASESAPEGRAQ